MKEFKARLPDEDFDALADLVQRLGFIYGKDTDTERPWSAMFCRSLVEASELGNVAIANNGETATITINLPSSKK